VTRRGTLAFAALGLAFALSACGAANDATEAGAGAGSPGEVVRAWATTQDVRLRCEQLVTARYVRTTYGSRQGCRKREAPSPQSRPLASRVRQSVLIRRARASADVEIKGGTLAGARGTIRLTRHGGTWRIDAVGTDFIRAVYAHSTFHQLQLTADEPGLRAGAARRCVDAKIGAHDERLVRAVWEGSEVAGETVVGEALFGCLNAPGTGARGASYLRARLITDVVDGEFGLTPAEEVCADRALRTKLSDREVLEHVRRDRSAPPPATARLAQLIADCKR
jgi:hypothetical protein